jgi:large subunit ribosomal protein L6
MSRVGRLPIKIPKNVKITLDKEMIQVAGPTGTLNFHIPREVILNFTDDQIKIEKAEDTRIARQKYGLVRSLINNMVLGVSQKFEKKLEMIGVGYKALNQGKDLVLNVGFTHQVIFPIPEGMDVIVDTNTKLTIRGADKEKVGLFAAKIRDVRPPEPYKGKGIKYNNEVILRKAGKSGK